MQNARLYFALIAVIGFMSTSALAADCGDYPYTQGVNVELTDGGVKIISTAIVGVSFADIDSIKDAREEATLEAKSLISSFMSEGIRSDQVVARAVGETKVMQGDRKEVVRQEAIGRVKTLVASSQALLKGVVPLGECYTKGSELRVSVGIKPETIAAATGLKTEIGNAKSPFDDGRQRSGSASTLRGSGDGYSNTERLKGF